MKISLNREYVLRHVGVGILFAALAVWSVWDGAVAWPAANAAWERTKGVTVASVVAKLAAHEAVPEADRPPHLPRQVTAQFYQAGLLGLAALAVLAGVRRAKRAECAFEDGAFSGGAFGAKAVPLADVVGVDRRLWAKKRILRLALKDGRTVTLDAWHHTGVAEIEPLLPKEK